MSEILRKKSYLDDQSVKYSKSTFQNRKSGMNKFEEWLDSYNAKDSVQDLTSFDINEFLSG